MHFPLTQTFASPRKPILKLFGLSIDATLAILLTHVGTMVLLALWMSLAPKPGHHAAAVPVAAGMIFDTASFSPEQALRLVLYPFRHDLLDQPLLFVVEMLLFFFCGRSLENQIGRQAMIFYYGVLMIFPPLLLFSLSQVMPVRFVLNSSFLLTVSLSLSYLLFLPKHHFHGRINLRFLTWLLIGFCATFLVAKQEWERLGYIMVTLAVSFLYLESIGAGDRAGILYLFQTVPVPSDLQNGQVSAAVPQKRRRLPESVDAVLDKISREGLGSLTAMERRMLDDASRRLDGHD